MSAMLRTMLAVKQRDRGMDGGAARGNGHGGGDGTVGGGGVVDADADGGDLSGARGLAEGVPGPSRSSSAARSRGEGQGGRGARAAAALRGSRWPHRPRLNSAEGRETSAMSPGLPPAATMAAAAAAASTPPAVSGITTVAPPAMQQLAAGHRDSVPARARPTTTPPAAWRRPGSAADITASADWEPASAGSGGGLSEPSSCGSVERARVHGLASCASGRAEQDDAEPRWVSEAGSDAGPRRCQSLGLGDVTGWPRETLPAVQPAGCASVATRVDEGAGAGPGSASPSLSVPNSLDDYSVLAGAGCHPLARVGADSDRAGGRKELARQLGLDLVSLSSAELDVEELLLREEGQRSAPAVSGSGTGAGTRRTTSAGVAGLDAGQEGGSRAGARAGGAAHLATSRGALQFTTAVVTAEISVAAPAPAVVATCAWGTEAAAAAPAPAVASSSATTLAVPGMGARRRSVCSDGAGPAVGFGASPDIRGRDVGRAASSSADDASSLAFTFEPRMPSSPTFDDPGQADAGGLGGGGKGGGAERVWEFDDASPMSSASHYRNDR